MASFVATTETKPCLWPLPAICRVGRRHNTGRAQREVCKLAVVFLRGLATGKLPKDRQTQIVLRQLGKCLSLWGLTRGASSGPSGLEIEFKHALSVGPIETQEQALDQINQSGLNLA